MQRPPLLRRRWHLIPANDKPYGRLAALKIMVDRLSKGVSLEPRPLDPKVLEAAEKLLGILVPANGKSEEDGAARARNALKGSLPSIVRIKAASGRSPPLRSADVVPISGAGRVIGAL